MLEGTRGCPHPHPSWGSAHLPAAPLVPTHLGLGNDCWFLCLDRKCGIVRRQRLGGQEGVACGVERGPGPQRGTLLTCAFRRSPTSTQGCWADGSACFPPRAFDERWQVFGPLCPWGLSLDAAAGAASVSPGAGQEVTGSSDIIFGKRLEAQDPGSVSGSQSLRQRGRAGRAFLLGHRLPTPSLGPPPSRLGALRGWGWGLRRRHRGGGRLPSPSLVPPPLWGPDEEHLFCTPGAPQGPMVAGSKRRI